MLEAIFASLPEAVVVCDREGYVLYLNDMALRLFEVSAALPWPGKPLRELLRRYTLSDELQRSIALEPWLQSLSLDKIATSNISEQTFILGMPSGWQFFFDLRYSPLLDDQKPIGTVFVFHEISQHCQKALHFQRVQEAVLALTAAIIQIPEEVDFTFSADIPLLSPSVLRVARPLVDVIRQVLNCWRVSLIALGPQTQSIHYAVGSGFTAEQEEARRRVAGRFIHGDFTDDTVHEQLWANQEVIISTDRIRVPEGFPQDLKAPANLLLIPWLQDQRLVGVIIVHKAGWDSGYTQEEVELVKVVAAHALLLIQYLNCLHTRLETQVRSLVQQEVHYLSNEFLTLASHELRTPLAGVKGNLQLAQRRLAKVKHQIAEQAVQVNEQVAQVQEPLAKATVSTRLQEHMIQDMIDVARLQANILILCLEPYDLLSLLQTVVASQQEARPTRTIVLEILTTAEKIPVMIDVKRITQVLTIYLKNALANSPPEQPVTVHVRIEGAVVRVSVHSKGADIPKEEQAWLWDRLNSSKENTLQHELDLSQGLDFYLCQALIARHNGSVGVQSDLAHGTTFWFTLPYWANESE